VTANLARPIDRPGTGAGLLVFLVSIGFIGAAIITAFAFAAFSSLYTGNETQTRSSTVDWSEVNPIPPDPSPSTDANAAPVKLDTTPSVAAASPMPAPSAPERPPAAEAAMPEAPIPETTQLQPAGQPSSSSEGALQPTARVEPNDATPAPPFAGEAVDRLFREFRSQQHQQVEPDPGIAASTPKTTAPGARSSQSSEYLLGTNTDARKSRIRKECGPIKDPSLYRECVATFNVHYRAR
jgi:cytoskeletal protein RodZ